MSWAWFGGAAEAQQQAGGAAASNSEPVNAGAEATAVSTGNSTFDSFNGSGMVYTTPGLGRSAYCGASRALACAAQHYTGPAFTTTYSRSYMMISGPAPTTVCYLISFRDTAGGVVRAGVRLLTDGTLDVRDNNTTSTGNSGSNVLEPWTTYRIEFTAVATGNMTVKVFSGATLNNAADGTATFSFTGSVGNYSWDVVQYGPTTTCAPITVYLGDCAFDTAAMPVAETYALHANIGASAS